MNWTKALIAGVAGGVVMTLVDYLLHGIVMADTYMGLPEVFSQEQSNPGWFFLIGICLGIAAAIFYAKTYACWSGGLKGGAVFGFFLGLIVFFYPFYSSLVIDGFPYFLSWCQGGIALIGAVVLGSVVGLVYKP